MTVPVDVESSWHCCHCSREVFHGAWGDHCLDCSHIRCTDCGWFSSRRPAQAPEPYPPKTSQTAIPDLDEEFMYSHPISRTSLLPIFLNRQMTVLAYADTGSQVNCIRQAYAKSLKVSVRSQDRVFKLPIRGRTLKSIGTCRIKCRFPTPPFMPLVCRFYVFPKLACDVILGNRFLRHTQTLDLYSYRLNNVREGVGTQSSVKFLGNPVEQVSCWLDGKPTWALADTGSTINLISSKLAETIGYSNEPGKSIGKLVSNSDQANIQLADGAEFSTVGSIHATVTFSDPADHPLSIPVSTFRLVEAKGASKSNDQPKTLGAFARVSAHFYLLENLDPEVILGAPLLNSVGAYDQYRNNFKSAATLGPHIAWGAKKKHAEQKQAERIAPLAPPRTDAQILGDEHSVVTDTLEQEMDSNQSRFNSGLLNEEFKQFVDRQAQRKYDDWLRANRERIERHWGLEWYLSKIPQEMG